MGLTTSRESESLTGTPSPSVIFFFLRKKNNDLEPRDLGSSPVSAVRLGPRSKDTTVHGGTSRVLQQQGLDAEPVRK